MLVDGLRELGVEVVEHHRPVWETTRDKSGAFLRAGSLARVALRWGGGWIGLWRGLRAVGPVDAVVAGYPGQLDALPARIAARRLRAPLVVDAMIALSDTLGDRGRSGLLARALGLVDRAGFRCAHVVMADTQANADWMAERFGLSRSRLAVVPVGAQSSQFPPAAQPDAGPVLFYGKLAPLHGLETIVAAARLPGVPSMRVIGDGQLGPWLAAERRRDPPPRFEHRSWVPYESLAGEIASSSVCLGVFGTGAKTARVVPNKVYQAMAVGRPIVTADTPGTRELLTDGVDALLVPPGDPEALAGALRRLADDPGLRSRLGASARARYLAVGAPDRVAEAFLRALTRASGGDR